MKWRTWTEIYHRLVAYSFIEVLLARKIHKFRREFWCTPEIEPSGEGSFLEQHFFKQPLAGSKSLDRQLIRTKATQIHHELHSSTGKMLLLPEDFQSDYEMLYWEWKLVNTFQSVSERHTTAGWTAIWSERYGLSSNILIIRSWGKVRLRMNKNKSNSSKIFV